MLSPGDRLGPYEVVAAVGAGGMGEVYRCRDTRLGRDVALKVLPDSVATDPDRLKRFEREARATAAISHPNVITVFDVGTDDGRSYVVTEVLDGTTLGARLRFGALPVREALSLAAQAARGLAAAHAKGIVHRDLKPENLFLTTTGPLKVLDFGLARLESAEHGRTQETTESNLTGPGHVIGTVSYMSPEQAKGLAVDARSDLFSLGVVLHEMLSGCHPFKRTSSAETLSAILRDEPPDLGTLGGRVPGAIGGLVRRCLEKRPEDRFQTASDLALALDILGRGEDGGPSREPATAGVASDDSPYPGLSSFKEADAAQFFGREDEVRALWEKIRRQKLLALIGPSGVGKTSFLRAGLLSHRPPGWGAVMFAPGAGPLAALAPAVARDLSGDPEATSDLIRAVSEVPGGNLDPLVTVVSRWRRRHGEALLVVDPFEEVFTLSPTDVQARFAALLGRLVEEADVHVVLSMRDDFLFRCHALAPLAAVFHDLTPLGPPSREALRQALVEPAARRGVRFEERALVDDMLDAAGGERGALPLLAFAVSRLWEERSREKKLMTREAYERIGGVAGALAQHAEATLARLGPEREGTVRELFRNLVTAEGTRAAREREELLSVFPDDGHEAGRVLDALVDARLLTEYDAAEKGSGARQIEIAHESLLSHWPRLVRWRTQEAHGAQLRDQLRQAARLWDERGRPEGLVWAGAAHLDYRAWRARYSGRLSSLEEDFARAMVGLADRRRRRQRIGLAAVVAAMAVGLGVLTTFWARSETARRKADTEALRAEASKLLAIGQNELDRHPTAALAYALKSLELADTDEARRFALRVLQTSPTDLQVGQTKDGECAVVFSPDGQWASLESFRTIQLLRRDGGQRFTVADDIGDGSIGGGGGVAWSEFLGDGKVLIGGAIDDFRSWTVPEGREIRRWNLRKGDNWRFSARGEEVHRFTTSGKRELIERVSLRDGSVRPIGSREALRYRNDISPSGSLLAYGLGRNVYVRSLRRWNEGPRLIGTHAAEVVGVSIHPVRREVAALARPGQIRIWSIDGPPGPLRILDGTGTGFGVTYSPGGRWLAANSDVDSGLVRLWDLKAPDWAEPLSIRSGSDPLGCRTFGPDDRWLGTGPPAALWPLAGRYARVLKRHAEQVNDVAFSVDGSTLLTASGDGTLRAWPMSPNRPDGERLLLRTDFLFDEPFKWSRVAVDPNGGRVALLANHWRVVLVPLAGGTPRELRGLSRTAKLNSLAFSPDGRRVAAAGDHQSPPNDSVVRVFDLDGGGVTVLPFAKAGEGVDGGTRDLAFVDEHRLLAIGPDGVRLLDVRDRSQKLLSSRPSWRMAVNRLNATALVVQSPTPESPFPELFRFDLEGRATTFATIPLQHDGFRIALDATGSMVATAGPQGNVLIGPASGGEPHLLLGHEGPVLSLAFSPDGRWLASGGDDNTVRLWPVPDLTRTPFHKRSHEEVLAVLRSFTNLRAVAAPNQPTGWQVKPEDPFPGWETLPTWE